MTVMTPELVEALRKLLAGAELADAEEEMIASSGSAIANTLANYRSKKQRQEAEARREAIRSQDWLGALLSTIEQLLKLKFNYQLMLGNDTARTIHLFSVVSDKTDAHIIGFLATNGSIKQKIDSKSRQRLVRDDSVGRLLISKGVPHGLLGADCYEIDLVELMKLYESISAGNMPQLQPVEGANGPTLEEIRTEEVVEPPEQRFPVG